MTGTGPVGVGVIGAGMISEQYLHNLSRYPDVALRFVADRNPDRARSQADRHGVTRSGSVHDLLADPHVEIVVNLTRPASHAEVSGAALAAGKHVWSEKPIGVSRSEATSLAASAREAGLLLGVAPDTLLGPGLQHAVHDARSGRLGSLLYAVAAIQHPGTEFWHPNPDFLYAAGGGPVLDSGPYYLSALCYVFGTVARVTAVGGRAFDSRSVRLGGRRGEVFPVETTTNVGALIQFTSGAYAMCHFSFDSPLIRLGKLEVTGTSGVLQLTDPNEFGGRLRLIGAEDQHGVVSEADPEPFGRGVGVVDMARTIRSGGHIVAGTGLALHTLDVLLAMDAAVASAQPVPVTSTLDEVPLLPAGWDPLERTIA